MWVLVFYVFANALSDGDSVALTNVPGFTSEQSCMVAGKTAISMVSGYKTGVYKCLKVS